MEPGSCSTIMGYAGICTPQNVQIGSDSYFHSISIQEIWTNITYYSSCATETYTNNQPPIVDAGLDFTIPKSTPFVLEDRKSTRLNSSHVAISYAVFCLKKK